MFTCFECFHGINVCSMQAYSFDVKIVIKASYTSELIRMY